MIYIVTVREQMLSMPTLKEERIVPLCAGGHKGKDLHLMLLHPLQMETLPLDLTLLFR